MRHVEAYREGSKTRINAIWSDENYEPSKIADIGEDLNVDPAIPSCPGCERLYNLEGDTEKDYTAAAYSANRNSVDQVLHFYDGVLRKDGWQQSPTAKLLEHLEARGIKKRTDGKMVQYSRSANFLTVLAWPGERGTTVHISRSN